jgi:signal transduction histidine kinase
LAALGEMAATVAHEVKNPLGGIRGFADLLDRDLEEGDPRKKSVAKITQGVETLDKIVLSLLNYTKVIRLNLHQVEFVSFIDDVIKFFEIELAGGKNKIDIVREHPEKKLLCRIDPEQFRQVILNLLHNATQAMPQGGKILIQVDEEGEGPGAPQGSLGVRRERKRSEIPPKAGIVLKISDTGVGMSKATLSKLFTPFFTTREHGTGLGLSTAKKIVEAHKGDIRVESKIGKGTKVKVRLSPI